jgi:hypothetical protein
MNGEGKRRKFWVITPIISKVWPVANPDTGWKPGSCTKIRRTIMGLGTKNRQKQTADICKAASPGKIPGPAWASGRIHFGV